MADKYYDKPIDRHVDWGGDESTGGLPVTGRAVQEFIKNEFGTKFGYLNMRFNEAETMYYIECFANEDDYKKYEEDKEANASLRLQNVQIPISTAQGDTYTALLRSSLGNTADIVVTESKLEVPFNFRAIKISVIGNENAGYKGTLYVQRSTDNGASWSDVGTLPNALTSFDYDQTTEEKIDLGGFLTQGRQMLRVRASYTYQNEEGEEKVVNSSYVYVGASVTRTSLRLELVTNYEQPMSAYDVNNNANPFSVTYGVYGSVQKTHYVKIDGGTPITYTYDASVDSVNKTVSANVASYMTHGVHKVESWLECEDGLGNTLKSDVLVNRFMVVNNQTSGADLTKPYLLLQNVDSVIANFVQTEIAEYAVYNPSGENVNVAFLLTAYSEDYETSKPEEYFRLEVSVAPNTPNKLLTTIEIENEDEGTEITKYDTYFRVRRTTDTTDTDFMNESTGEKSYYVVVDNSNAYTPVSGAAFLLNPKVRNNNEDNPRRILNAKNNNAEVESVWTNFGFINDGWMTADDGQKVLRVMAGSTLEIKKNIWAQFLSNPNSSLTFEIDFKIDNVTNMTDPIVRMFEGTTSSFKGLLMNALDGWLMNASNTTKDNCLFSWQEGVRTHVSINLHHQVKPNKGDVYYTQENASKADGTIALARVIMNGDCIREIPFSTSNVNEWCSSSEGSIIIGNEGADIDIYSIRIYEGKVVEMTDILNRNYLATLPKAEDKTKLKEKNDLLDGGRISLEKTKNKGLNCYVWHGTLPYHGNQAEQNGWVEIFRYDSDGNYLPEYSGTICKETKSLVGKGQGSTAKTYYDWNLQEDSSKVKATIQVPIAKFHSEIHIGSPYTGEDGKQYVDIYGGNLGKNIPIEIEDNAQAYEYVNGMVVVPDGWFDGNGMYRGLGYRVAEGTSLAQKRVIKINYASSMQSHLIGACNTYDLLHRKVVGDTPLQQVIPSAVSAKRTEPFMFFNQQEGGEVYFKGMCTYGAGKADKVTWGFVKKQMPMYALIEGSDNNLPMTGFRVPFDKNTAVYDAGEEGWLYNGQQSFDFDLGNTDDNDVPTDAITQRWADIHNFIYLHSTNLKYFNGTLEEFLESSAAEDTNYKYWYTQGSRAFYLYRYDFIGKSWVNAGLFNGSYYNPVPLNNENPTITAYNQWIQGGSGDYSLLNEMFKSRYVEQMRNYLKYFINEKSLQFNYCYVLGFLAGTDNSDKNTYYKIDPIGVQLEENSYFEDWFKKKYNKDFDFASVHQLYFDGDDMDSIFKTNNNSHQTKPYYIDRMHPYADGSTTSLYEGMGNQLFNFVEKAYESTGELSSMMNQIMIAATELVQETDKMYGLESGKVSLWGFLHKYFFNIQHYFPQIAYMEQARIRYEFPELLGFISSGGGARSIRPITQSLGSQLQNELQYMNQRVIYMTSYAAFGAWGGDGLHSIGLADANDTFGFMPSSMPDGSAATYSFTITPHQYIYPSWYEGQTFYHTNQRTAPNQTCTINFKNSYTSGDVGIGICGINYISDLGDFSKKRIKGGLVLNGRRLVSFNAVNHIELLQLSSLQIQSRNIKNIWIYLSDASKLVLNVSHCVRLQQCRTLTGDITVEYPKTHTLTTCIFSYLVENVEISHVPNLNEFRATNSDYKRIGSLFIGENVGTNTGLKLQPIVESIYSAQKSQSNPNLQSIHVENVNWTDFDVEALSWFADRPTCEFKGTIAIKEDGVGGVPRVTWDLKNKFYKKFGLLDRTEGADYKGLSLIYTQRDFDVASMNVKGNFYVEYGTKFQFSVKPESPYSNSQGWIGWSIKVPPSKSSCKISSSGELTVNSLSDSYDTATIEATINNYYGVGFKAIRISKTIELWNRPAQLGDLVYADGTFSSAESYDGEKTPIGLCFWVGKDDGSGKYMNPNDKQKRLMVALEDAELDLATGTTSSLQWGCMPLWDESQNAQYALYDTDSSNTKVNLTCGAVPNVYDITDIVNLTTRGLDNAYINPDPTTNPNGESDYRDLNTEAAVEYNDGFKLCEPNTAIGDGFAYNETSTQVKARTLTDALAKLAGSAYSSGDIVNSGYAKTLKIIAHRNALLSSDIIGADNAVLLTGGTFELPKASGNVSEMESLATLIDNIRAWANNTLEDAYPDKWSQLAYPAISACYAYEPKNLMDGEVLADKFKAHNWFLPAEGLLARICWFLKYGEIGGMDVFKGAREKNLLNNIKASSFHCCVTELTSYGIWFVHFNDGLAYNHVKRHSSVGRVVSAF